MGPNLRSKGVNHECSEDHTNRCHRRRRKLCSPDSPTEHRGGVGIGVGESRRSPCLARSAVEALSSQSRRLRG